MTLPPYDDQFGGEGAARPPGHWDHISWGIREIVIGIGLVLLLFAVFAVAIAFPVIQIYGEDSLEVLAVQVLTALLWDIGIIIVVFSLVRRKGGSARDLGLRRPQRGLRDLANPVPGLIGLIAIAYFSAIALVQVYGLVLNLLDLDDLLPHQQLPDTLYENDWILISFAIVGMTLVPFAEELLFRGFFFAGLRRSLSFPIAAALSGFCFSLAHADPGLIIPFTGVGVILAYTYERTGSLFAPVGVHMLFNSVSFLILILVPDAR
jgi:membrane protease YdiL (CAAX protease family)